jgi:hypothetical protein
MLVNTTRRRTLLAVPIALLLASAAPAQAAGFPVSSWTQFWGWLSSWSGPGIDPLGGNGTADDTDEGIGIDPDGRGLTRSIGNSDVGSRPDPDGRNGAVISPPTTDSGSRIDPLGGDI